MDQTKDTPQTTSLATITTTTIGSNVLSPAETALSPGGTGTVSIATSRDEEEDSSNQQSSDSKSPGNRTKSNQRWMKLRTTVQISSAISSKKPPLKREDSFLKRFSTRQIPETQETVEDTGSEGATGDPEKTTRARRQRYTKKTRTVVNPDENFYFYWLMVLTICVLYNLWTLIVRQSFPELQEIAKDFWFVCDCISDVVFILDVIVQLRTGYLEQGLMVYNGKKLAGHYLHSRAFLFDLAALIPLDILQIRFGSQPLLRFPRFLKVYRAVKYYYIVESRTVWPNLWRVVNLIHILLILAHWFGCFYYLLSEVEGFQGDWVYPYRPGDYATLTRKYLGSLYWSTLTLTTIGDLPTPETNAEYIFTIVSYLIGVFIFATIVGQVGNVITNRNANRLEFERLLDGAKTYMRHHKVPGGMKRRVLRWYDYSWSRGRIQGGGDINTALGLLPDKLKTELALHVNLSVLKKVTIFQECQPEFLHDLVLKMKAYIFTPGDSICRKGEVAREMFIIADGILEVLSETGKVLTTMKAGDFFGEIGILNLDGLNKRTADVRSVGYSELFSLSREDVLAAMKDYPEAQEILQTLGRKRLMEVRCVNKKHQKKVEAALAATELANAANGPGDSSDSTSKRIVEKLRSDVKGLKNVLKKSTRGSAQRRSQESIELQPLHSGSGLGFSLGKTSKNVLRRMPRVRSDDFNGDGDEINREPPMTPSPIGAGLPLLQRLRLLKEKQDREERAAKSTAPVISPPNTHVTKTISPQESIQEEPEPEVIGAGLPLFQRLKLLKAKEEKMERENAAKLTPILTNIIPPSTSTSFTGPSSPGPATTKKPASPPTTAAPSFSNLLPSLAGAASKAPKVSFKDRIKNLQQESKQDKVCGSSDLSEMKQQLLPSTPSSSSSTSANNNNNSSSSSKISKPSTAQTIKDIKDKIRSFSHLPKDEPLKPWSKLKLATVNAGGSYTSLNNSFADDYSPFMNRVSSKRKFVAQPARNSFPIVPSDLSIIPQQMTRSSSTSNNKVLVQITNEQGERQRIHHIQHQQQQQQMSVSDSEIKNVQLAPALRKVRTKPKPFKLKPERKSYCSVDDLSPEYCGLPFVKKLKILNERQKLAELESVIQTRSFSLDCTETTVTPIDSMEPLTRSHSEASGIAVGFPRTIVTTTTHTFTGSPIVPVAPLNFPQCLRPPLSPESNETLERRQLKSILKKLSEDKLQIPPALQDQQKEYDLRSQLSLTTDGSPKDLKRLMRAQTMEGYAARHTKLMKSVTFNRNTLSSPPNSANICEAIEERSLFPLLSAQPPPPPPIVDDGESLLLITTTTTTPVTTITTISSPPPPQSTPMATTIVTNVLPAVKLLDHSTNLTQSQPLGVTNPFQTQMALTNEPPTQQPPPLASPPSTKYTLISPKATQMKLLKGSIEEHEYFGEVLLGIKQVIQNHLVDISGRFHEKFTGLESEVHRRDEIISQLQQRIVELEEQTAHDRPNAEDRLGSPGDGTGGSGSSNELPFMRGDSLDTIFASSPTSDTEVLKVKMRNRKRNSPRHRRMQNLSWGSSDQDSFEVQEFPRRQNFIVSEVTGNIITDSVIVDIESSQSSGEFNSENDEEVEMEEEVVSKPAEGDDTEDDDDQEPEEGELQLHHNDWELQMLAAELDKRESKSDVKAGVAGSASEIDSDGLLRRRRKRSDTDTDISETTTDSEMPRPRAASFDQHNLRRGKCRGVFDRAMSFDRDKDRL